MLDLVFNFFANYLIELMGVLLVMGLGFRWASYQSSKAEDGYFTTFTGEVEKVLLMHKEKGEEVHDVEKHLGSILDLVKDKLPKRSVRQKSEANKQKASKMGAKNVVTLREFSQGEQNLFISIMAESGAFKSKYPPNFQELADRILERDPKWNKLLKFFPIGPISRLIDVLPGLFVVFGIFGTFIGISMALPAVAKIDFNNLEASGAILTTFVQNVTYAMKTSIAGILFSLIMTVLNTIAPVSGLRRKTFKRVSSCFEAIWHSVHGTKTAEEELTDTIPKLLAEVKHMRQYICAESEDSNDELIQEEEGFLPELEKKEA